MPQLIPKFVQRWFLEGAEPEQEIDPGVRAIADSFYEPDRWAAVDHELGFGISAFEDSLTHRVIYIQDFADLLPYSDPDLSAPWIPDRDLRVRGLLSKEWKKAQDECIRVKRIRRESERAEELEHAKQDFLKVQGDRNASI